MFVFKELDDGKPTWVEREEDIQTGGKGEM